MTVEVNGSFDSRACGGCSVRSTCSAGEMVLAVEGDIFEQANGIYESSREDIVFSVVEGVPPSEKDVKELCDDLEKARARSVEVRTGLEQAFTDSLRATNLDSSRQIELNDHQVEMERVIEDLGELPHPNSLFKDDKIEDFLAESTEDILRFAEQGICGAIDLEATE